MRIQKSDVRIKGKKSGDRRQNEISGNELGICRTYPANAAFSRKWDKIMGIIQDTVF
jgi:hypothetical protein